MSGWTLAGFFWLAFVAGYFVACLMVAARGHEDANG